MSPSFLKLTSRTKSLTSRPISSVGSSLARTPKMLLHPKHPHKCPSSISRRRVATWRVTSEQCSSAASLAKRTTRFWSQEEKSCAQSTSPNTMPSRLTTMITLTKSNILCCPWSYPIPMRLPVQAHWRVSSLTLYISRLKPGVYRHELSANVNFKSWKKFQRKQMWRNQAKRSYRIEAFGYHCIEWNCQLYGKQSTDLSPLPEVVWRIRSFSPHWAREWI